MTKKLCSLGAAVISAALLLLSGFFQSLTATPDPLSMPTPSNMAMVCLAGYFISFLLAAQFNFRPLTILCAPIAILSVISTCYFYPFLLPLLVPSIAAWLLLLNKLSNPRQQAHESPSY